MELSTAIAIGIIKAIAMIAGGIAALAFLGFIVGSIGDVVSALFDGLLGLIKWLFRKWKWLVSFAALSVMSLLLGDTEFGFIFSWLWGGFYIFCIAYFIYWKNEESNKKDALYWASRQSNGNRSKIEKEDSTIKVKSNNLKDKVDNFDDETFIDFIKRNKFYILFFVVIIVIANIF